jgi:hypothetical protein
MIKREKNEKQICEPSIQSTNQQSHHRWIIQLNFTIKMNHLRAIEGRVLKNVSDLTPGVSLDTNTIFSSYFDEIVTTCIINILRMSYQMTWKDMKNILL